jgi:hypothetical protein
MAEIRGPWLQVGRVLRWRPNGSSLEEWLGQIEQWRQSQKEETDTLCVGMTSTVDAEPNVRRTKKRQSESRSRSNEPNTTVKLGRNRAHAVLLASKK